MDEAGNLYGTTLLGGSQQPGSGLPTFSASHRRRRLDRDSNIFLQRLGWNSALWSDCSSTKTALLYGTTEWRRRLFRRGTVFQLIAASPNPVLPWTESVLYSFSGGRDGGSPVAGSYHQQQGPAFWNGVNREAAADRTLEE